MAYSKDEKELLIDEICKEVSKGQAIKVVLESNDRFPTRDTFYNWIRNSKEYSDKYARACILRSEIEYEKLLSIADDSSNDIYFDEDKGREVVDHENIQRSRLRVDTRKWWLSKMVPKVYGDRIEIETVNDGERPADALAGCKPETLLKIKQLIEEDKRSQE